MTLEFRGPADLQAVCERGQEELIATRYLDAAATLATAEAAAWDAGEYDTLARLYLPLQEARRQVRQRCGEGAIDSVRVAPVEPAAAAADVLARYPHAQLNVSQLGSVEAAAAVRRLAASRGLYVETFLTAGYPSADQGETLLAVVPLAGMPLPAVQPRTPAALRAALPPGCLLLEPDRFPRPTARGTPATFAAVMSIWEQLHAPFLAAADVEPDPIRRMQAYRRTIIVDPACEFAHQRLAAVARQLARDLARRR